jgi:regulator of RNase E activity RraB
MDLKKILTSDEIEEIELTNEMCEGLEVDGEPIICFDIVSKVINNELKMDELSRSVLLNCYRQLKEYNRYWEGVIWFDNQKMEQIIPRIRNMIKEKLKNVEE